MAVLPKILKDNRIRTAREFRQCLKNGRTGDLRLVTADSIGSLFKDGEPGDGGIHCENIILSGLILDIDQLTLFPGEGLVLRNCIFTGSVSINGKHFNASNPVEIESCIFMKELIISGFTKMDSRSLSVYHTNAAQFSLYNIKSSEIVFTGCRIFFLSMHELEAKRFDAENNCFRHFEIEGENFERVDFDHRQVDIEGIGKRLGKNPGEFRLKSSRQLALDMNLFQFIPYKTSEDLKKSQAYDTMIKTLEFYKNSTSVSFDRNRYMKLLFYEALLAQDKPLHKAFVQITGGFLKPSRFIIMAAVIFMLFTGLYMLPLFEFNSAREGIIRSLSIGKALYFSGATFTTIGYGDISPIGISRIFAVFEGLLGISVTSSFLVALVKKYID